MTVVVNMVMLICGQTVATLLSRLYYNSGGNSKWMTMLTFSGGAPLLAIPLLLMPPPSPESIAMTVATLLSRLYYNSGGNSKWMTTLTFSGGAPLLAIPLLLMPQPSPESYRPAASKMVPIYAGLGVLIALNNLMYSYGLQYLPVSTFSLLAATQLAFNAVTSRFLNAQRFTPLIANSVVVLTFSAALLGVAGSSDDSGGTAAGGHGKYAAGFILTLAASATVALVLSLFELTFEKAIRSRTLRWVLAMQLYTSIAASAVCVVGMFASGEWRTAASVGSVRLISRVSALFANVSATVGLPLVPVFAVALFGDRMTGIKVIAMLMALWGFLSYVYQHYIDGRRGKVPRCRVCAARPESNNTVIPPVQPVITNDN
ncbi:hypothetical protein PR202_gb16301 [Eleusine coracana subsp. coracana]|uniref:Probable purine permease n=1 Tax=Eleusine coracana subsp. coracana TaxID=191504 RepID=A0AAV5F001_ELECO|nr:hypothetical protein PR202_gb16301 [Eleusine coracana subsp. coracana]